VDRQQFGNAFFLDAIKAATTGILPNSNKTLNLENVPSWR
jgi:hypothetical protein